MNTSTATKEAPTKEHTAVLNRDLLPVCILDDDASMVEMLSATIERLGCEAMATTDPQRALDMISQGRCRVVLCDLRMPAMDGLTFLKQALERDPGVYVILMTGFYSLDSAIEAVKRGAYDYLPKPIERARLKKTLDEITDSFRRRRRIRDF